jgi:hypothetical protein
VKPSFEYLMQQVELEGKAKRAVQVRGSMGANRPDGIDDFRLLSFEATETVTQHAIGGGIEVPHGLVGSRDPAVLCR